MTNRETQCGEWDCESVMCVDGIPQGGRAKHKQIARVGVHECALIGGIAPHLRRFPRRSRDGGCGGRACVPIVFAVFVPLQQDCTCGISALGYLSYYRAVLTRAGISPDRNVNLTLNYHVI